MSYNVQENSPAGGTPYELYLFITAGQTFRLTSSDEDIVYSGQTFVSTPIKRTELEATNEVVSGEIKIQLPSSHPLAALFIPYLPPTPMNVTIFGGHFSDLAGEVVVIFSGAVTSTNFTDQCEFTCRSDVYLLQRQIPKKQYQGPCTHIFGDRGCGINLALFTYPGTVTAIDASGTAITVPELKGLTHPIKGGWFQRGNDVRMVVEQVGAVLILLSPMAGLELGDACFGVSGCGHRYADCKGYANVANFLGFDLIPILNPFDGSVG